MAILMRFKVKFSIISDMIPDCNNGVDLLPLVKSMYSNMGSMLAPHLVSQNAKNKSGKQSETLSKQTGHLVADVVQHRFIIHELQLM